MATIRELENLVKRINRITGNPETPYTKKEDGSFVANIGNYHLSGAYGGYGLHKMVSNGGRIYDIFGGYMPARELYGKLSAFLMGLNYNNK